METDPYSFVEHLCQKYGGSSERHSSFGAVHWKSPSGEVIHLTQTRKEVYPHKAHLPKVSPADLATDLQRRDFTINAMALSLHPKNKNSLIYPLQGQSDLKQKILRILHPLSLWDDPTRIFRGARYASRYGLQCSKMTLESIQFSLQDLELGKDISWQRIGQELERVFQEQDPISAWNILKKWNVLKHWFPSWQEALPQLIQVQETEQLNQTEKQESFWAVLSIFTPEEERKGKEALVSQKPKLRRQWRELPLLQKKMKEDAKRFEDYGFFGDIVHKLLPNQLFILALLFPQLHSQFTWWKKEGRFIKCTIRGQDLLAEGCPQGPLIGKALSEARRAAWRGFSSKEQIITAQKVWLEVSDGNR